MLERTASYYLPLFIGATISYARSIQTLGEDIRTTRPSIFIGVPRIYNKIFYKLNSKFSKSNILLRTLWKKLLDLGYKKHARRLHRPIDHLLLKLLDLLIAKRIRSKLGGNLRLAVSGGAALSTEVSNCFLALNIPLVQGYGLTESSPVVSVNQPHNNIPKSVGTLLNNVEARLGDNNELLIRSKSIMMGYCKENHPENNPIDPDGFLHTGDQVKIDKNRIYITGRIKEVLVLSNGEKIPPSEIENAIKASQLFDEVIVFGEGKSFIGAVVQLNPEQNVTLGEKNLLKIANEKLDEFPAYMKLRKIIVTSDEWSIENGLLTPTMKPKRNEILKKYEKEIERCYTAR